VRRKEGRNKRRSHTRQQLRRGSGRGGNAAPLSRWCEGAEVSESEPPSSHHGDDGRRFQDEEGLSTVVVAQEFDASTKAQPSLLGCCCCCRRCFPSFCGWCGEKVEECRGELLSFFFFYFLGFVIVSHFRCHFAFCFVFFSFQKIIYTSQQPRFLGSTLHPSLAKGLISTRTVFVRI
jgi:hypothetical protein